MNIRDHTDDHLLNQFGIDWAILKSQGWVSFNALTEAESQLSKQLRMIAGSLGEPVPTRSGGGHCDTLIPTNAMAAKPRSLSKTHSIGEFPLHVDTAHWITPCRYIVLACVSPGSGNRPTLLLDTRRTTLNENQKVLLYSTPFRVTNGRNSYFSTILSKSRPFVRFDPGCMSPTTAEGTSALGVLARHNWTGCIEAVTWETGKVVIVDNWRVLHGRADAERPDPDRKLLRISIL